MSLNKQQHPSSCEGSMDAGWIAYRGINDFLPIKIVKNVHYLLWSTM